MCSSFKKALLLRVADEKITDRRGGCKRQHTAVLSKYRLFPPSKFEKKCSGKEAATIYTKNKPIISQSMLGTTKPIEAIDHG